MCVFACLRACVGAEELEIIYFHNQKGFQRKLLSPEIIFQNDIIQKLYGACKKVL